MVYTEGVAVVKGVNDGMQDRKHVLTIGRQSKEREESMMQTAIGHT